VALKYKCKLKYIEVENTDKHSISLQHGSSSLILGDIDILRILLNIFGTLIFLPNLTKSDVFIVIETETVNLLH